MKRLLLLAVFLVFFPSCARKRTSHEEYSDFKIPECSEEISIDDLVDMEEPYYEEDYEKNIT